MRSSDDSTFKIYYSQKEFRKVIADPKIYKDILGLSYYLLLPKRVSKLDPLIQVDVLKETECRRLPSGSIYSKQLNPTSEAINDY